MLDIATTNGVLPNDYICVMLYKRKKKAAKGAKVNGDPTKKPITKESNLKDMAKHMGDAFPNVSIPDKVMKGYAMTWLLTGRRDEALKDIISKEKERQSKGLPKPKMKT